MKTYNTVETYIDTLGIRCVCDNKYQRESIYEGLLTFINNNKIAVTHYDDKHSSQYYQITKVQSGNTTLATIARGYYDTRNNGGIDDYYYLNINFYGLKRYNDKKDTATALLVQYITAYLNTNSIYFTVTELDVAMDIRSKLDNVLAVCVRRSSNVEYYTLGDVDENGNVIQENKGTYYIERYASRKKRSRAVSRAYLYDKRKKEIDKYKRDIGFELTRFEVKLQKKFFTKKNYEEMSAYKALSKYAILQFSNTDDKAEIIEALNHATSSSLRRKIIKSTIDAGKAIRFAPEMFRVGDFLREIDTIKLNAKGGFTSVKRAEYLWTLSRFNNDLKAMYSISKVVSKQR